MKIIAGSVSKLFIMPVDAEPLDEDGGQMFYGTPDGLGSTSNLAKFVQGPVTLGETEDPESLA